MTYRPPAYGSSYTVGPPLRQRSGTSSTEVLHLTIAFIVLTFDLMLILGGDTFYAGDVPQIAAVAASAALTGFLLHEMAHKVAAQMGGYWAEFRLSPFGLFISVITAAAGFLFAAPGATMIGGMGDVRDWGRTSLAGPATNFVFSLGFLSATVVTNSVAAWSYAAPFLLFLAFINGWFAAFNMIPFGPLDGAKVLRWNRTVWVSSFVLFAALAGFLYFSLTVGFVPTL